MYNKAKSLSIKFITNCIIQDAPLIKGKRIVIDSNSQEYGAFDLIVDASGMNSNLRSKYGKVKRNLLYPYGAIWGVCQDQEQNFGKDTLQQVYSTARYMVGMLPIGTSPTNQEKQIAFFWSIPIKDFKIWKNSDLNEWKKSVANLWPQMTPFLQEFSSHEDLSFSQYRDISMKQWHSEHIVFIGDAAHCTSPQLGQGANLALIDALTLSECIDNNDNINAALYSYNSKRKSHILFYQMASRLLTPFFQSNSLSAAWLRDFAFASICKMPYIKGQMVKVLTGTKSGIFGQLHI